VRIPRRSTRPERLGMTGGSLGARHDRGLGMTGGSLGADATGAPRDDRLVSVTEVMLISAMASSHAWPGTPLFGLTEDGRRELEKLVKTPSTPRD